MAKYVKTELKIAATPEKIWSVLTNFEQFENWNPFIIKAKGNAIIHQQIEITIQLPNQGISNFKPTIVTCKPNQKLEWLGRLFLPGIFDGKHSFEIVKNQDGTSTFKHQETFTGILVWILNLNNVKLGFELMNQKIKELAEA